MLRKEVALQGLNDLFCFSLSPVLSSWFSHLCSPNWLFPLLCSHLAAEAKHKPLAQFHLKPFPSPTALLKATLVLLGVNCPSFLPWRIKTSPILLSPPPPSSPPPKKLTSSYLRKTKENYLFSLAQTALNSSLSYFALSPAQSTPNFIYNLPHLFI